MLGNAPGPCWQFAVDNVAASPGAALVGTNFTTGVSNADGATVTILSALAQDLCYVVVGFAGTSASTEDQNTLADIVIDRAGGTSWGSFIDDLVTGFCPTPTAGAIGMTSWYHFPLSVPAGASLGVRARHPSANTNTNGRCVIYGFGRPKRPDMWWCGQGVESVGINAGTSKGTAHTPGNSSAYSAYATIGTTTRRFGALQFGVNGSDGTMLAIGYNWQLGISSAQIPGTPTFYHSANTTEQMSRVGFGMPLFVDIPAGTTIQCRATGSGTAEAYNVAVYGVY